MFTISVKYDEKRSTTSQYENVTAGVLIEASNLELTDPEAVLKKSAQLFELARRAVQRELAQRMSDAPPERLIEQPVSDSGHASTSGNGRRYGRGSPDTDPTPKQKALLHKLARERNLGPESIREICERIAGCPVEHLDRKGMGRLIDGLLAGAAA
jgi:hypothetical protein